MNSRPRGTTMMSGSISRHIAIEVSDGWRLSWLPDRVVTQEQAATGMRLADEVARGLSLQDSYWCQIDAWAAELSLDGIDAARRTLWPAPPEDNMWPGHRESAVAELGQKVDRMVPRP